MERRRPIRPDGENGDLCGDADPASLGRRLLIAGLVAAALVVVVIGGDLFDGGSERAAPTRRVDQLRTADGAPTRQRPAGTITFDGRQCAYSGERIVQQGRAVVVALDNQATQPITVIQVRLDGRPADADEAARGLLQVVRDLPPSPSGTATPATVARSGALERGTMTFDMPADGASVGFVCLDAAETVHPAAAVSSPDAVVAFDGTTCTYEGPDALPAGHRVHLAFDNRSDGMGGLLVMRTRDGVTLDEVRNADFSRGPFDYALGVTMTYQTGVRPGPVPVEMPADGEPIALACLVGRHFAGFHLIDDA